MSASPVSVVVRQPPQLAAVTVKGNSMPVVVKGKSTLTAYPETPAPLAATIVVGGLRGPPGPPGPGGSVGASAFEYVQAVPATSWTVVHDLGIQPSAVAVYDTSNNEVMAGMRVIDLNTIVLTFAAPMAGRVEIS